MQDSKDILINKLIEQNRFWSYNIVQDDYFPDDLIIEKTLIYLDIDDLNNLFSVYSKRKIKQVWLERLVLQGDYYRKLNRLLAWMYFDVKNPDKYINKILNKHIRELKCRD